MSTISASTTSTTAYKVTADTTGTLVFQTGASPTTAMTLGSDQSVTFAGTPTYSGGTANGVAYLNGSKVLTTGTALVFDGTNLGVGTTSPSYRLEVRDTADAVIALVKTGANSLRFLSTSSGGVINQVDNNPLAFYTNNTERASIDSSGNFIVGVAGSGGNQVRWPYNSASASSRSWAIRNDWSNFGDLAFVQSTTQTGTSFDAKMTIDSSGNLLVGTTSQPVGGAVGRIGLTQTIGDYTNVFRNSNSSPYGCLIYHDTDVNGTSNEFYRAVASGTLRFSVRSNGGIANYSANNSNLSDRREKTNFAPAGNYLAKICAIPVQTYNYIDQNLEEDDGLTLGVVAQDVQAVAPELVTESNWGTEQEPKMRLSIYQTDMQYALMKCIQEQQAIIEQLRADVETLKGAA